MVCITSKSLQALVSLVMSLLVAISVPGVRADFFNPKLSHAPKFPDSQLYNLDVGLGAIQGRIVGLGDFNSDKYADIIALSNAGDAITVWIWDDDDFKYNVWPTAVINTTDVINVSPIDYNYDGRLDLLVSTQVGNAAVEHAVYLGDGDSFTQIIENGAIPNSNGQLSVLDANQDLLVDFFGETEKGTREYWMGGGDMTITLLPQPGNDLNPLAPGYSHAFVDLNGDCLPDLAIVSQDKTNGDYYLEIWRNDWKGGDQKTSYTMDKKYELPAGVSQLTFQDMDADGSIDLVYAVCFPVGKCTSENAIHIAYNLAYPYCGAVATAQPGCRDRKSLCSASAEYGFDSLTSSPAKQTTNHVVIPASVFGTDQYFVDGHANAPLRVRLGDYDLDGYPDALVALRDESTKGKGRTYIALLHSEQCSVASKVSSDSEATTASCVTGANQRRTLRLVTQGTDALTNLQNAYAATFIDLGDTGSLDILVMTDPANDPKTGRQLATIQAVFNNFYTDAFFVKTMGLNGVCPAWCKTGSKFPKPKPYGGIQYGVAWKYTITDLNSKRRVVAGAQLTQSSYGALEMPYWLFGLGRANNYMDELWMGVPLGKPGTRYGMWRGIIPNSQLAATPYERNAAPFWDLWLFISPSANAFWVFLGVVTTLVATGLASLILKWREVQADKKEEQDSRYGFSFQAL